MITQDAFIRGESLIATILQKMFDLNKRRRETVLEILMMYLSFRGRINFSQMERQGSKTEKSYRNHFEKNFDWITFNTNLVKEECGEELILGFDPSYISKPRL